MADLSRRDLKRNELEDMVLNAAEWIKNNRQYFLSVAGIAAAALALTIFFFSRYHLVRARADEKLAYAEANFYQGKTQEALKFFDEISAQYPGTPADHKARLHKTAYLLETQQYDEAEKTIGPTSEKGIPKTTVPLALSVLGAVKENAGKYSEAAAVYSRFLDSHPEHFYAPKIFESLARVQELLNSRGEALSTYEKLATLYPGSAWEQRSRARIAALKAMPAAAENK